MHANMLHCVHNMVCVQAIGATFLSAKVGVQMNFYSIARYCRLVACVYHDQLANMQLLKLIDDLGPSTANDAVWFATNRKAFALYPNNNVKAYRYAMRIALECAVQQANDHAYYGTNY